MNLLLTLDRGCGILIGWKLGQLSACWVRSADHLPGGERVWSSWGKLGEAGNESHVAKIMDVCYLVLEVPMDTPWLSFGCLHRSFQMLLQLNPTIWSPVTPGFPLHQHCSHHTGVNGYLASFLWGLRAFWNRTLLFASSGCKHRDRYRGRAQYMLKNICKHGL